MRSAASSVLIAVIASVLMLLPAEDFGGPPRPAFAASGATLGFPPNYDFTKGPILVGTGPTNYDFSSGSTGWFKVGTTISGGVATMSGSSLLRSSYYTLEGAVHAVKIRYKAGADALVGIQHTSGSYVGSDDLSCTQCTTGEWVEKYIGMYASYQGTTVRLVFSQLSGGQSEIDEAGTQWLSLPEWRPNLAMESQPKNEGDDHFRFAEVRSNLRTGEFDLTENRIEFDYAFPLATGNSLSYYLHRASDGQQLASGGVSGNAVGWTTKTWTWISDYVGETVYVRFYSTTGPWLDNVGINLVEASLRKDRQSAKAGDPFDTTTGNFSHSHTDLAIPGKGIPLQFTRTYASMVTRPGDLGYNWTHNYSTHLRVDGDGSVTVYYDGGAAYFDEDNGTYTPPAGVHDTLTEDSGTYTLTTVSGIEYNYDSDGKLTSIVDRNGSTTTVSYDVNGFLSEVEDAGGRTLTFTVDTEGRITQIEDPLERTVGFEYDEDGDLVEVTDVKGGTTTYTYDDHRMTSLTDSNGNLQNETIYDSANRVVEQTDATGGVTCAYYGTSPSYTSTNCTGVSPSPSAGQTIVTDPAGNKTTYDFDTQFRTTSITDHNGGVTSFEYDSSNNRTCIIDPLGNKTGLTYDSNGNVTHVIDAANTDANCDLDTNGVQSTFTYTANNDLDLITDPLGRQTDYVYDASGNLTEVIRKDDQAAIVSRTCFTRDGDGLMTEFIESTTLSDCTGNVTEFEYDTYGNQTAVIDPRFSSQQDPPKTVMTYDLGGRMLTVTNELNETTTFTYDAQDNILTIEDDLGNTASKTYDQKGNLETVTDANRLAVSTPESGADCGTDGTGDGVDNDSDTVVDDGCPNTIFVYDSADRLVEVIDALGSSTTYGYDANGNRTSVTNANRQPVNIAESGTDCGTAGTGDGVDDDSDTVVDDGCPSTMYSYDELNGVESVVDALGHTTNYVHDAAGNLIERTDARGLVTEYDYDELNRLVLVEHWDGQTLADDIEYTYDEVGNRETMVDDTGTTSYDYDALDRPSQITFPGNTVVAYEYDEIGNRVKLTYPDSKEVDYTYDEAHNLETVTDWLDEVTTYTYDDAGRLENTALPNGIDADYTYDGAGRLDTVVNADQTPTTISSFDYTVDAVGNRTAMEDLEGAHSYEYDALYRLTEVTYPDTTTDTYTYDAVGNRLTKNTDDYTYDAANQLTGLEGLSFDYDDNGNQADRGSDTFGYDHENRLVESVIDSVTSTSVYNGDGLRMSHTVGMETTNYVWDVGAGLPVVLQDGENTYVYGRGLISAADSVGDQIYFLYDGLGSVVDVTDENGGIVASYSYDVFGAIRSQTGSSDNYWLFTGQQEDSESALYFLRARYYDPATGRFLSRDPVMAAEAYAYSSNNPTNLTDPAGTCIIFDCPDVGDIVCLHPSTFLACEAASWAAENIVPECDSQDVHQGYGPEASCPLAAFCLVPKNSAECIRADEIRDHATEFANTVLPCNDPTAEPGRCAQGTLGRPNDRVDRQDAFRHCYGSALMTLEFGADFANKITDLYEAYRGNPPSQKAYDVYNNQRGREFAELIGDAPDASARLARYCKE